MAGALGAAVGAAGGGTGDGGAAGAGVSAEPTVSRGASMRVGWFVAERSEAGRRR